MTNLKQLTLALYRHHFVRYLFVGGSTFVIDFAILYILHGKLKLNLGASASVSYWISIMYNFALNRYWTFDAAEKTSLKRNITTYFMLLVFNYLFTVTFVSILGSHFNYIAVKALAVLVQMTWTYVIYKKYIFVTSGSATTA